jgi:hypothetical protein
MLSTDIVIRELPSHPCLGVSAPVSSQLLGRARTDQAEKGPAAMLPGKAEAKAIPQITNAAAELVTGAGEPSETDGGARKQINGIDTLAQDKFALEKPNMRHVELQPGASRRVAR